MRFWKNWSNLKKILKMTRQDRFNFEYGVTKEQSCIMCHLSSECGGCCAKCRAEGMNGTCYGQNCSIPSREHDGQRWDAWIHLLATSLPELERFIPKKYRKYLRRIRKQGK